mmetsp:Transcript_13022/g.31036  ORF Transcript_13022/g.31036 Transcript_13022/m.31036 type:complete len:502 (+) Transcript_13022:57-1562(+)
MILAEPLRGLSKALTHIASAPKECDNKPGAPVVRIRLADASGGEAGWYWDAHRSVRQDQRDSFSTYVNVHRPGIAGGEWRLERGSGDFRFRICFASHHFSQPSGWFLDVADEVHEDFRNADSRYVIVRKGDADLPPAEWIIEPASGATHEAAGLLPGYMLRLADGPEDLIGWHLTASRRQPRDRRTSDSMYLQVSKVESATWLMEVSMPHLQAKLLRSLSMPSHRFYEVVIFNLSGRQLHLQGCKLPATRKTIAGRLLHIAPEILPAQGLEGHPGSLERLLLLNPEPHPSPTIQAMFHHSNNCGDLLEFTVTYLTPEGGGVTIHAHAHEASSMQSSVQVHGQEFEATSVLEQVPRLQARPPQAHAPLCLGVHARPSFCDAFSRLNVGEEMMAGMGPRSGRWLKITYPVEGWVQASTRDGQQILREIVGIRPNLRQVVTLRPVAKRQGPALPQQKEACPSRSTEHTHFKARAEEACRLSREIARLEATGPLGTPRKSTLGVF